MSHECRLEGSMNVDRVSRSSVAGGASPSVLREENEHSISYVIKLSIIQF